MALVARDAQDPWDIVLRTVEDPLDIVLRTAQDVPEYDPLEHAIEIVHKSGIANRRVPGTVEGHLWAKYMRAKQLQRPAPPKAGTAGAEASVVIIC